MEFLAYNQGVISEFRANQGVVSQPPKFPILLLTTTGARTGRQATVPLGFPVDDNGRVFVMASKAGSPRHPAWFHNLRANPSVTVELSDRSFQARAVVTAGEERDRLYRMISDGASPIREEHRPGFPGHRPRRRPRAHLCVLTPLFRERPGRGACPHEQASPASRNSSRPAWWRRRARRPRCAAARAAAAVIGSWPGHVHHRGHPPGQVGRPPDPLRQCSE